MCVPSLLYSLVAYCLHAAAFLSFLLLFPWKTNARFNQTGRSAWAFRFEPLFPLLSPCLFDIKIVTLSFCSDFKVWIHMKLPSTIGLIDPYGFLELAVVLQDLKAKIFHITFFLRSFRWNYQGLDLETLACKLSHAHCLWARPKIKVSVLSAWSYVCLLESKAMYSIWLTPRKECLAVELYVWALCNQKWLIRSATTVMWGSPNVFDIKKGFSSSKRLEPLILAVLSWII